MNAPSDPASTLGSDFIDEPSAAGQPRQRRRWTRRFVDAASTYLPLLLMAALALGTWWLVKNTPALGDDRPAQPLRHVPDYTMTQFRIQRFAADGTLRAQIEGDAMRHYPDTDQLEIDNPRIRAIGEDGRVATATARSATSNRDASEVQLSGDAHVVREAVADDPAIDFRGESLQYFRHAERVESSQPVKVLQGGDEMQAEAMRYDHARGLLQLRGRVRAVLAAPGRLR